MPILSCHREASKLRILGRRLPKMNASIQFDVKSCKAGVNAMGFLTLWGWSF
jgi:hypothetical protein